MNDRTFSQNPRKRGRSHYPLYHLWIDTLNALSGIPFRQLHSTFEGAIDSLLILHAERPVNYKGLHQGLTQITQSQIKSWRTPFLDTTQSTANNTVCQEPTQPSQITDIISTSTFHLLTTDQKHIRRVSLGVIKNVIHKKVGRGGGREFTCRRFQWIWGFFFFKHAFSNIIMTMLEVNTIYISSVDVSSCSLWHRCCLFFRNQAAT